MAVLVGYFPFCYASCHVFVAKMLTSAERHRDAASQEGVHLAPLDVAGGPCYLSTLRCACSAHAQRHTALSKCSAGRVRGRRGREQALCLPCWLLGETWARLRILHEGFGHVGRCFVRSLSVGALSRGLPNWATGWSVGKKSWRRPCTSHVNVQDRGRFRGGADGGMWWDVGGGVG